MVQRTQVTLTTKSLFFEIFYHLLSLDCLMPCTQTQINTVFINEKKNVSDTPRSRIDITFSRTVDTTIHDFPLFSLTAFLSSLGGSLGLWLGLSVLGIIDILIGMKGKISNKNILEFLG